jgi:uncharacterized Tic20 family protein
MWVRQGVTMLMHTTLLVNTIRISETQGLLKSKWTDVSAKHSVKFFLAYLVHMLVAMLLVLYTSYFPTK